MGAFSTNKPEEQSGENYMGQPGCFDRGKKDSHKQLKEHGVICEDLVK